MLILRGPRDSTELGREGLLSEMASAGAGEAGDAGERWMLPFQPDSSLAGAFSASWLLGFIPRAALFWYSTHRAKGKIHQSQKGFLSLLLDLCILWYLRIKERTVLCPVKCLWCIWMLNFKHPGNTGYLKRACLKLSACLSLRAGFCMCQAAKGCWHFMLFGA